MILPTGLTFIRIDMKIVGTKYGVQRLNGDWFAIEVTTLFGFKFFTYCIFRSGDAMFCSPGSGFAEHETKDSALKAIQKRKEMIRHDEEIVKLTTPIEWVE